MENTAVVDTAVAHTQVFIVRIWHEAQGTGQSEVRIQARHVLTGETRYFLEWPALTDYLAGKVDAASPTPGDGVERTTIVIRR